LPELVKNKITMQMIADKLGITKVSVSKALNNQPGVSSDLKKKIMEVARETGYTSVQRKPRTGPKRLEFIIRKKFFLETDKFYTVIYYTMGKLCNEKNIRLSMSIIGSSDELNIVAPPSLLDEPPDGIFICGEINAPYAAALASTNTPVVSIDFCHTDQPMDSIVVDNFYSSYCATQYLISQGHSKIGFVGDPFFAGNIMDRYLGFVKAMKMNGLPINDEWLLINNDRSGSYNVPYTLPSALPTVFLCHCDMAAYHMLVKLQNQGIVVPAQVSLLSFDNTDLSRSCIPMLSTIDIDKVKLAQLAFDQMLQRLDNPTAEPHRVVMDTKMILRDSVLPVISPPVEN
jgi:LacI family transcriptional regulator